MTSSASEPALGDDALARHLRDRPDLREGVRAFRDAIVRESGLSLGFVARCGVQVRWLLTAAGPAPRPADALERVAFAYAEKFVRDPHGVTEADVAALREALTVPQVVGLTELLALLDGFTRLELILDGAAA